jgi:hypothetical protein
MNKWQEGEVSKQYKHLYFTILMCIQNTITTRVTVCSNLKNKEKAGQKIAPACSSIFVDEFEAP